MYNTQATSSSGQPISLQRSHSRRCRYHSTLDHSLLYNPQEVYDYGCWDKFWSTLCCLRHRPRLLYNLLPRSRLCVIVDIIIPLVANCFAATNLYHTYGRYLVITSLEALEPWRLLL